MNNLIEKDNELVYADSGFALLFNKECGRFPTKKEFMYIFNDISNNPRVSFEPGYFMKVMQEM